MSVKILWTNKITLLRCIAFGWLNMNRIHINSEVEMIPILKRNRFTFYLQFLHNDACIFLLILSCCLKPYFVCKDGLSWDREHIFYFYFAMPMHKTLGNLYLANWFDPVPHTYSHFICRCQYMNVKCNLFLNLLLDKISMLVQII